jgi:fructose 5-dehydrogenase small subunit
MSTRPICAASLFRHEKNIRTTSMDQIAATPAASLISVKRRGLLLGIGATALVAGMGIEAGAVSAPATGQAAPTAFTDISRFITGSKLDDASALDRAWSQLVALDAGFPEAVRHLSDAVKQARLTSMAAFLASPLAKNAALIKTATTITSAFYLGFTGTPVSHRDKDDTGFVTFAGALMWRPTIDNTVIPTFARGKTDYWIEPPSGTATPKGPQGQSAWQGSASSSKSSKA